MLSLGLTNDTAPDRMQRTMDILGEIVEAQGEDTEEKVIVGINAFGDFALGIAVIYYITKGTNIMGVQSRAGRRRRYYGLTELGGAVLEAESFRLEAHVPSPHTRRIVCDT